MQHFKCWILLILIFLLVPTSIFAEEKWEWNVDHMDSKATVGKMAQFQGRVLLDGKKPNESLEIVMTAVSEETGAVIFQTRTLSKEGEFKFNMQFYDGSPHQVRLEAFQPGSDRPVAKMQTDVDVTAISPPISVQIKTMLFLLLITFLSMMVGVSVAKWREKKQRRKMTDVLSSAT